ncbi:MAG: FAD-dependent oxidoreductase, partial [Clostridia bacterium]|nr:FAD-dependent oxidoreductase [Clostridia bacterium]
MGAKRESRRMLGDYILTANDILEGKIFPDTVAYGGWPLDDHNPDGFDGTFANHVILVPKPYGIPYRCLYSENIDNLFFAGRNISLTHKAMSSARVMGTCGIVGQAVGVAGYLATKYGISPREVIGHIDELQQTLLAMDCYLPETKRKVSDITLSARFDGDGVLRNGYDRDFSGSDNKAYLSNGESVGYSFDEPTHVKAVRIVFDSDLTRSTFGDMHDSEKYHSMRSNISDDAPVMFMPKTLVKEYEVVVTDENGENTIIHEKENLKRNIIIPIDKRVKSI